MELTESMLDEIEDANCESIIEQLRRSEVEFREGPTVTREEVKRRNNLDTDTEPRR